MLQIDKTIISFDILEKEFACDLKKCKGSCCVEGDAGAPLEENEIKILKKIFPKIKSYIRTDGVEAIEKHGVFTIDEDGDKVTTLINNKDCAFSYIDLGVVKCAIEKAYFDKKIKFRKPISCHLYPIRITKYDTFDAINYHRNDICNPALLLGSMSGLKLYQYLEEPLTRKYGRRWYKKMKIAVENLQVIKQKHQEIS